VTCSVAISFMPAWQDADRLSSTIKLQNFNRFVDAEVSR
jgi:hypothetical protein